jgi:hypothetical protein
LLSCATGAKTGLSFNLQIILRDFVSCGVFKDVNKQRHKAATTKKDKIMKKTILVAVAGIFTLVASAQASDALLSPRAQDQSNSLKTVSGMQSDMIDRSVLAGSPKSIEVAKSFRKAAGTNNDLDLANAPRPNLSPKDPRYQTALRENASSQQIQVAPLK